jgi:aldose 1-epimerase
MRIEIDKFEPLTELLEQPIDKISLINNLGMSVEILTYGCIMFGLNVPDRLGNSENILVKYDDASQYARNLLYLNATIGLNAGRLEDGQLTIGTTDYQLEINERVSNLHGGSTGLDKRVWVLGYEDVFSDRCEIGLRYSHEHLEDGFPGNIEIKAIFTLYDDNTLKIAYTALSDRDCHLNMTNHNYYNLSGNEKTKIDEHSLFLNAEYYLNVDENGLPIVSKVPIEHSPFDFGKLNPIKQAYQNEIEGIDHPFALEDKLAKDKPSVIYHDPISQRTMSLWSNQPALVVYTNNVEYKRHGGICFEPQQFPNTLALLEAGEKYLNEIILKFY